MDNNNDVLKRLLKISKVSAIIGVCTLGVCPAFGAVGVSVVAVLKQKKVKLTENQSKQCRLSVILSIISFALFAADVALAFVLFGK